MKLTKNQRLELFNKFNGKCAYCGDDLPSKWHADHIKPLYRTWEFTGVPWDSPTKVTGSINPENDTIDNLNPSCPACNIKKGVFTIEQFREELYLQIDRVLRDSNNFKFALKYNQVKIIKSPIVFYFERFEK